MKNIFKYMGIALVTLSVSGCADYLDVVPDKTQEVSLLFERKESAQNALATCYHYIYPRCYMQAFTSASNEIAANYIQAGGGANHVEEAAGLRAVMGRLNANVVTMSFWTNTNDMSLGMPNNYQAIRICNTFLDNIDLVPDMTVAEKEKWKGEVLALKALYHFELFKQYGPIILMKESLPIDASEEEVQQKRSSVTEAVDYMVELLDKAIPMLPDRISSVNDYGHINQAIAKALKAKVLLFAASPLFNNNPLYAGFKDKEGNQLFPIGSEAEAQQRWQDAANALKDAVEAAEIAGAKLYHYEGVVPDFDQDNYNAHIDFMKPLYDYRYMMTDNTNMTEIVWGTYNIDYQQSNTAKGWMYPFHVMQLKAGDGQNQGNCWQWMAANMAFTEEFYTKNGLPIDEDPEFDYEGRYDLIDVPDEYAGYLAKADEQTARMHFGREPRFYATFGFDRALARTRGDLGELFTVQTRYGEVNGMNTSDPDWNISGYAVLKLIHPSWGYQADQITHAPWPIIRLAELYLAYAEALNEVEGPTETVIHYIDLVRARAGIPGIREAWAKSKNPAKPNSKEGMREIIQRERNIELSFEGYRNEDTRRWLKGTEWFNQEVTGWTYEAADAAGYYHKRQNPQIRQSFNNRNYLWPITADELVKNKNLVQNPGY